MMYEIQSVVTKTDDFDYRCNSKIKISQNF